MCNSEHRIISLTEKVAYLPLLPGLYMYKDKSGSVLYVGKAKKLRNRLRSYFQESRSMDGRIRTMISKIYDFEVVVNDSDAEALILENNFIKQHQPRYNILYRDDKSYPYICVTKNSKPRVYPTRTMVDLIFY
jgi:excinuclease ABC subunit C